MVLIVNTEERWVDVDKVAAHLSVSRDTVYRWIEKGLPARRAGRLLRFRLSEIDAWILRSNPADAAAAAVANASDRRPKQRRTAQ